MCPIFTGREDLSFLDLWAAPMNGAALTASTPTNLDLGTRTMENLPPDVTIARAVIVFKVGSVKEDSGSENSILGDQEIQIKKSVGGVWTTGATVPNDALWCAAGGYGSGDIFMGDVDIKDQIPANGEDFQFRWLQATSVFDSLYLFTLQAGVRIFFNPI